MSLPTEINLDQILSDTLGYKSIRNYSKNEVKEAMKEAVKFALDLIIKEQDIYYDIIGDPHVAILAPDVVSIKALIK